MLVFIGTSERDTFKKGCLHWNLKGKWKLASCQALSGYELEHTPGDSGGQGSLAYCSPWGCKESDMTE